MLKYLEETKENGIGIGIGIKASSGSKVIRGFPKFVDFGLASQKGIVRDYENEDKSSWRNLIPRMVPHINSMAREMMSLDGSLYSDTDRLNASYTVLLLCKAYLGEYPESVLDEIGLFNKPESSLEYIGAKNPEYIDDLLESYSEIIEIDGLKDSLRMLVKGKLPADKLREVFLKLADSYLGGYSYLEKPHQTLRLIVNGETYMRRFSQTASLIYGDNIVHNSKPLFKENKDYLLEKKS